MMDADEGTAARISGLIRLVEEKVAARAGRVFKTMGDAVLANLASGLNRCVARSSCAAPDISMEGDCRGLG